MNPIPFAYTPTLRDYNEATQESFKRNTGLMVFRGIAAGLLIVLAATFVISLTQGRQEILSRPAGAQLPMLFVPIVFLLLPWFSTLMLWFRIRANPVFTAPVSGRASDAGLSTANTYTDVTQQWITFTDVLETKSHFLLVCAANQSALQIIPKRAFGSVDEVAAFRTLTTDMKRQGFFSAPPRRLLGNRLNVGSIAAIFLFGLVLLYLFMALTRAPATR